MLPKMFLRGFCSKSHQFIKYNECKNVAVIQLDRPKALNAISTDMFKSLYTLLSELENKKSLVIFKGNEKFLSAGGDVKDAAFGGLENSKVLFSYAMKNFRLVHNYQTPYVPLMHGICFGGASPFTVAAKKYRVTTETTEFAMPEVKIGFFNDNGSSYFLSRLPKNVGFYISLTAARVKGSDLVKVGLADYFVKSDRLEELERALIECTNTDGIERTLKIFSSAPANNTEMDAIMPLIDKCFDGDSVEEIIDNLHLDGSEWSMQTVRTINKMSPTSLKVCHKLITMGKRLTLDDCLKLEYRMAIHHSQKSDIHEGIRALLIDKDNKPQWNPKTLHEVSAEHIDPFFGPLKDGSELSFDN